MAASASPNKIKWPHDAVARDREDALAYGGGLHPRAEAVGVRRGADHRRVRYASERRKICARRALGDALDAAIRFRYMRVSEARALVD